MSFFLGMFTSCIALIKKEKKRKIKKKKKKSESTTTKIQNVRKLVSYCFVSY